MASRQRNQSKTTSSASRRKLSSRKRLASRKSLLETLETRQLLAGPQLIGIQPNEGELVVDGSIRHTAPRVLTFRFDENQTIDPATFDGIEIVRAGGDGMFDPTGAEGTDDIVIEPALVSLGEDAGNEVVVRFADSLPDDAYQIRVNSFDDPANGITALRNTDGEPFISRSTNPRTQTIHLDLQLGALIESVVPQPLVRGDDGSLTQNRNEIVVYFNEDPLFVEDEFVAEVQSASGSILQIEAAFPDGQFADTDIQFATAPVGTPVSAEYFESSDSLVISARATTPIGEIVDAINLIPRFEASTTSGSSTPFDPGVGVVATIKPRATARSAENPRFYQLFLTQETVRTTDDALYFPEEVVYDAATHTARLFFATDLNELGDNVDANGNVLATGVGPAGGTFRLRIGTAVDQRVDVVLEPTRVDVVPQVSTDFGIAGLNVRFLARTSGEPTAPLSVAFVDSLSGGLTVGTDAGGNIVFDFGGSNPEVRDLQIVVANTPSVASLLNVEFDAADGLTPVPGRVIGAPALTLSAVGDTLSTALDVGTFGKDEITSLIFSESIIGRASDLVLPGADLVTPENGFAIDTVAGVPTVPYNFNGVFDFDPATSTSFLNQITEVQKTRIREALGLWSDKLGVQFRETVDEGITFARGDRTQLQPVTGTALTRLNSIDATLRIDSTFNDSAIVFSNQADFETVYGADFTRKAAAGIGLLLGLNATPDLPPQTLLALNRGFLAGDINPPNEAALRNLEPVFPSNFDVLQGQALYRPDGNDVDLYRFVVDLNDVDQTGTFTAETFAERLPDSSLLDTTLTLFQEQTAMAETDFGLGRPLNVRFESQFAGKIGNDTELRFTRGATGVVSITPGIDGQGNTIDNVVVVEIPFSGTATINDLIAALNDSPISSSLFTTTLVDGDGTQAADSSFDRNPIALASGGLVPLVRNDDYFSEDSRIVATLGAGTYYVGVASTGNATYDPTVADSGFGGRTGGQYDVHFKFEPQVDEVDTIRDLDGSRPGVPSTPIDGDGDGVLGGVNNFWFQTRALNRRMEFTSSSAAIQAGQTIEITDLLGESRTYEFVPVGSSARPGNVAISYPATGLSLAPAAVAQRLVNAFNLEQSRTTDSGQIGVSQVGTILEFFGVRSIETSSNFRGASTYGRMIFVDKTAGVDADGSLSQPFNNISDPDTPNAFGATAPGDIVRIVGNGGVDGIESTESDNLSYQIGVENTGGGSLDDGRHMEIPFGVTTMIDAGAIFKLRNSRIGVGSSTLTQDRSGGALQVLGTPRRVELSREGDPVTTTAVTDLETVDGYRDGAVIFTSLNDSSVGTAFNSVGDARPGDWGGIVFRRDVDQAEGRSDLEDEGIFMQYVSNADIRYGGSSNVIVDAVQQLINPIQIFNLRPTVTQSEIRLSADAAISASPDSFEETTFQAPRFQSGGEFTADYDRVGPAIYDNFIVDNTINGLFIRVVTTPGEAPRELTLSGRFDDTDIVHYFAENLKVSGTPGGSIADELQPDFASTAFNIVDGGTFAAGSYNYRLTFVDAGGFESLASDASVTQTVVDDSSIELLNLPPVPAGSDYLGRRLYRLDPATGDYLFVAQLNATQSRFLDNGGITEGVLDLSRQGIRGRLDASLVIDPATVIKLAGVRIELGQGTHLYAEGVGRDRVVFTSFADDRFGAGGTFDTNNDANLVGGNAVPDRADWAGIYASPTSYVSFDFATIAYAGGISLLEGGVARGFIPLELQQAGGRVTNTRFEFNDDGQDGAGPVGRFGRLGINPATIFVRGSQPTIVANEFIDNRGSIIDIDVDSMGGNRLVDAGRQTEFVGAFTELEDNYGPLIRLNRYESVASGANSERQLSGLEIRGGVLTTETIFDDTDIDHLLFDGIEVGNQNVSGGLRLLSRSGQSLVVKLSGSGSQFSETFGTGFTATGSLGNDPDRVGGSLQIVGQPGAPVVLTSLFDDTIGSGLRTDGSQLTDTGGDGAGSRPEANDWRSVLLDRYSNDRNVDYILEQTISNEPAPGLNGTVTNAQNLGTLATNEFGGDEVRRLGFEVEGFLTADNDIDNYSFTATAGTRVWLDIDNTTFGLDTVVELIDEQGNVLARSNDSAAEVAGTPLESVDESLSETAGSLSSGPAVFVDTNEAGLYDDIGSVNPRDAGFSVTLPGNRGSESEFKLRIRSRGTNPDDLDGGLSNGGYRFQLRIREDQEFPGSVVRFADIRYANHGIHVIGKPGDSPLLGDAQENEAEAGFEASNDELETNEFAPGRRAQYLGNLQLSQNGSISVGGEFGVNDDGDLNDFADFYRIDVVGDAVNSPTIFDIDYADGFSRPDTTMAIFYDADGDDGDDLAELVLFAEDSNILDDQALVGSNDPLELLRRGSIGTGDAYIGPVALPQGVYYIGILPAGRTPEALALPTVRREPLDSVLRIFDDQIESTGGTTFAPPVNPSFVDTVGTDAGWAITTERSGDAGHVTTSTFTGSRTGTDLLGNSFLEPFATGNNLFANAVRIADFQPEFSRNPDPNIGNDFQNTSTFIPHTTIVGSASEPGGEVVDIYSFEVPLTDTGFAEVILDIDNGFNPFTTPEDADLPDDIPLVVDPNSIDLKLELIDASGAILETNQTEFSTFGQRGSEANFSLFSTSFESNDPYISATLPAGQYFVAVSPEGTIYDAASFSFTLDAESRPDSGTYQLHVSIEDHPAVLAAETNLSYRFDRSVNTASGTLRSIPFDLSGYSAGDQPRLYFNHFYEPALTDLVTVTARSAQQTTPLVVAGVQQSTRGDVWEQTIGSLAAFAGDTDVVIEFNYETDGSFSIAEGLYIDDIIVGFAERGELVTGAIPGDVDILGTTTSPSGEYQLEIRPGSQYSPTIGSLDTTFHSNDRLSQSATIVAPLPSQLVDGDTFALSDEVRTLSFEFDVTGDGGTPGNIRIDVSTATTQAEVAEAIRAAINLPLVGSTLVVKASDTSGNTAGGNGGGEIAITGTIVGDFIELGRVDILGSDRSDVTDAGGQFQLPVRFFGGLGDGNVVRAQSQIIIDSNKISDVRGIGIWSEFGERLTSPQDERGDDPNLILEASGEDGTFASIFEFDFDDDNDFLELTPMGNTTPGAVRNLPTLNNSLIGGLTPGPVIVNNTIDNAGYAGIKVDGANRPLVIDSFLFPSSVDGGDDDDFDFGSFITDGLVMVVEAAGTRVAFEFEEIGGAPVMEGGSGTLGGDGFADGHVPIYYSHARTPYNPGPPFTVRTAAHTRHEVMMSIYQSIQGSILVGNGMVDLVHATLGPSPFLADPFQEATYLSEIDFPTPAVFIEGASGVYWDTTFQKIGPRGVDNDPLNEDLDTGAGIFFAQRAPIHEAPQPTARIVNNTIYGNDGTASGFSEAATRESNDVIEDALRINAGSAHDGFYQTTGVIGDELTALAVATDVDMFQVNLTVGDRLIVDVDTDPTIGLDTTLRLFDSSGNEVALDTDSVLVDHLDPIADFDAEGLPVTNQDVTGIDENDDGIISGAEQVQIDPSIDFAAQVTGTYYVAISSEGNDAYDPFTVDGRIPGVGGTGQYDLSIEVLAPRSFVFSLDNDQNGGGFDPGTQGDGGLIGATFTVTQVADDGATNQVVFEFTEGGGTGTPGAVPIALVGDLHVPDIMRQIANAIDGADMTLLDRPVVASALGGVDQVDEFAGAERGLTVYNGPVTFNRDYVNVNGIAPTPLDPIFPVINASEFQDGFGHNRTGQVGSGAGSGTTELYVLVERAAKIELSQAAIDAGLALDPQPGQNSDQLLPEVGLMLTGGSSATVINNVFANLHQSLVVEQSRAGGFSHNVAPTTLKPADVIVTANVFQDDNPQNTLLRQRINTSLNNPSANGVGLTTDAATGPSNVNDGNDDRNEIVDTGVALFQNPGGNNFLPAETSTLIDGSISSVTEREALINLRGSLGLSISNILAPGRDGNGVLRKDNPDFAPDTVGGGSRPFLDQGANELADDTGPTASIINPLDNDPEGIDLDPETGFLRLNEGVYQEFRIQLRDTGDASDPFNGLGVDDTTVVVSSIPDLRSPGANLTLFENDQLLVEGVDYTFDYDATQNVITLRPLAGIFQSDRSYRIALNNRDSTVLVAPAANGVSDGQSLTVTDEEGFQFVYEFETGITVNFPDPITMIIPEVGVGVGGINDNDLFTLADAGGATVTFEFDNGTGTLSGTVPINLPTGTVPSGGQALQDYRAEIATSIEAAILSRLASNPAADPTNVLLDLDVRRLEDRIIVGGEEGAFADTESSGLQQLTSTLALRVPLVGLANRDGDLFVINDGSQSVTFELDIDGNLTSNANVPVFVGGQAAADSASAILQAIVDSDLSLQPVSVDPQTVYLNLPAEGSVDVITGPLEVRGIARLAEDGTLIIVDPPGADNEVVFELNRTDLRDVDGNIIDDTVDPNNRAVDFERGSTAEEVAQSFIDAIIAGDPISGISENDLAVFNGNLLSIGGSVGTSVTTDSSSLGVIGRPGVTESSNLAVAGPILLSVPFLGGNQVEDGDILILTGDDGTETIFEFTLNGRGVSVPGAEQVNFTPATNSQDLAIALINAINAAAIGIDAASNTTNQITLGVIAIERVNITGVPSTGLLDPPPGQPADFDRGLGTFTLEQGLVSDGEVLTITQGDVTVSYEFESAAGGGGVRAGNVPISFDPDFTPDPNVVPVVTALETLNRQIASTIANNLRGLQLAPVYNEQTGRVTLNDQPGTVVDDSQAPSLRVEGVPGGAIAVVITPEFTPVQTKQALIAAINSVQAGPDGPSVQAFDRGGSTFFVSGGALFDGPLTKYNLPAIADLAGEPLKENRADGTTQFTLLLPTIDLDFGDAPDPVGNVAGRYPTRLINNGPRHVVGRPGELGTLMLGTAIDADIDGLPSTGADGDDLSITAVSSTALFGVSVVDGVVQIEIRPTVVDPLLVDGETITITSGAQTATLEFDVDGRFDEDNFAISPSNPTAVTAIRQALVDAIEESPLAVASVMIDPNDPSILLVSADDEDGVDFSSDLNPDGFLNADVPLVIDVTVTGAGVVEAWIDFDADGVFAESEQIIPQPTGENFNAVRAEICPESDSDIQSNIFAGDGTQTRTFCVVVPPNASLPETLTETYARFRVSREGQLSPTGLALSGEVEDYNLLIQPGSAPVISDAVANRSFRVNEDLPLQVLDRSGALTPTTDNDDGLLVGVIEPDGQNVAIIGEDIGVSTLLTESGGIAGQLEVFEDGTFTFTPEANFFGSTSFSVRVTDVNPLSPENSLVSSARVNVDIVVDPVNDRPEANQVAPVITTVSINEDSVTTFLAENLIDPFYSAGPANELDQPLIFQSVSGAGVNQSTLRGSLAISTDGRSVTYTPPADENEVIDTFTYVVADIPGATQASAQATRRGTVSINLSPVNDPPRTGDDEYRTDEGQSVEISVSNGIDGILDNDFGGPENERDADLDGNRQAVQLVETGYPLTTFRGGTVTLLPSNAANPQGRLVYEPPAFFNGVDTFSYRAIDVLVDSNGDVIPGTPDLGQESIGTVNILVGGVNNGPEFLRVDGSGNSLPITRDEAKPQAQTQTFDLDTFFRDREGDSISYAVTSSDPSVMTVDLQANLLTLEFQPFRSGTLSLTIVATDAPTDGSDPIDTTVTIPVIVNDTPDAPEVISSIGLLQGLEDEVATFDLSTVFFDRDGELGDSAFSVTRFGNTSGTPGDIAVAIDQDPLVQSIDVVGGELRIVLEPNQFGEVNIELTASDGDAQVTDSFILRVSPRPDAPELNGQRNDGYNVPIGSELDVIDPNVGLLQNVVDADGDAVNIAASSVGEFSLTYGTLTVRANGAFTYFSDPEKSPAVGDVDSFSYVVEDATGLSSTIETFFEITQSRYQNPIGSLQWDVNADGSVSPIDSLRVINFLRREQSNSVEVGDIGAPPPDYVDVDGNGRVTPLDALAVINELRARRNRSSGESLVTSAIAASSPVALSLTTSFASIDSSGLGSRNLESVASDLPVLENASDQLFASGIEIQSPLIIPAGTPMADESAAQSPGGVRSADDFHLAADEAFADLWNESDSSPLDF